MSASRVSWGFQHKFRAVPTTVDGYKFHSKKESQYYQDLKLAQTSGQLLFFLMQVPIHISPGVTYRVDFVEFWANGDVRFVDVKGLSLPMYKTKKILVEQKYPFRILEG